MYNIVEARRNMNIRELVDKHEKWVNNEDGGSKVDFYELGDDYIGCDFSNSDLRSTNFNFCDLKLSTFSNSNLSRANMLYTILADCNLEYAKFYETNLKSADLSRANLFGSEFYKAKLDRADFSQTELDGEHFGDNGNFELTKFKHAHLQNFTFDNSEFEYTDFSNTILENCMFTETIFDTCTLQLTKFVNCEFRYCNFENANTNNVTFENCDFFSCNFNKEQIEEEDIAQNDYTSCTIDGEEVTLYSSKDLNETEQDLDFVDLDSDDYFDNLDKLDDLNDLYNDNTGLNDEEMDALAYGGYAMLQDDGHLDKMDRKSNPAVDNSNEEKNQKETFIRECEDDKDPITVEDGQQVKINTSSNGMEKPVIGLLLCMFFGVLGVHKFYEKKIGLGLLYLFTLGLLSIGCLVDIIFYIIAIYKKKRNKN